MKKVLIIICVLFAISSTAQIKNATLTASGLTCSMCSKAIYKALQKVNSIEAIQANIKQSSYDIQFKKDVAVDLDMLRKAVEGAGFTVAKLEITISFSNMNIHNDTMINSNGANLHFLNVNAQTLNGDKILTVVDEHFISQKDHQKFAKYTNMKCFETGISSDCCNKNINTGERIYHVTI